MRMRHNLALFLFVCACATALTCTRAPVAGDVTETGNAVCGLILDPQLYPACSTLVMLVPSSFDPVKDQKLPDSLADTTDSLGRYRIKTGREGLFNLIAYRQQDNTSAIIKNITVLPDTTQQLPAGILSGCGALSVQEPRGADSSLGYIYILGTTFYGLLSGAPAAAAAAGSVLLPGLPACTTAGVYYSSIGAQAAPVLLADSAIVVSGDTSSVYRVSRGTGMFIGIDDGATGFPILRKNSSLFDVRLFLLNGTGTNGWYTRMPNGSYLSGRLAQADSIGLRPSCVFQGMNESSFDSIKTQFGDANYMNLYFTQYIAALQMVSGKNAILVLEPLTLAYYAQRAKSWPATCLPGMELVKVKSSGISQVQGYEDNFVGFMQALVGLAHSIAPDASAGIFLLYWALRTSTSTQDLTYWTKAEMDQNIREWDGFLSQLGIMDNVDFISFGKEQCDAGFFGANSSGYWGSAQFDNFLYYSASLRKTFVKPLVGWFLPIGHRGLPNTVNRYEDVFAEYFFANSKLFTDAGYCGMLFGAYNPAGTDISETQGSGDDGWFISQVNTWRSR
jgi:hypothetical protein